MYCPTRVTALFCAAPTSWHNLFDPVFIKTPPLPVQGLRGPNQGFTSPPMRGSFIFQSA